MEIWSGLGGRSNLQASSSNNPPPVTSNFMKAPEQVNESLYELHRPKDSPAMRVYFFHGLQFGGASEDHFWTTWQSEDRSCVWPATWLVEDFPNSQIFLVSYDGAIQKSSNSMDMYQIAENLMHDFLQQPGIGQESSCPIVLVGHCFGGIVIKQLCLKMNERRSLNVSRRETVNLQAFFDNMKGIFYYDTPHHGIPDLHKLTDVTKSPLLSYFASLSKDTVRLNNEFHQLRRLNDKWRIQGLGANLPTKLSLSEDVMIVPESSGRDSEGDFFVVTEGVDHYSICKPRSKKKRSYYALKDLLNEIADDPEAMSQQCPGLPRYRPGLQERAYKAQAMLASARVVGIVGMGGIGKTTIAMQVFTNISKEYEYTCFVDDVKGIPRYEWRSSRGDKKGGYGRIPWSDLEGKNVLIVMDDVDSETQLRDLRDLDYFGNGTCLIVTTRNRGVLGIYRQHAVYDVDLLTKGEAKELFCQYTFGKEGLPNINPLSKNTHLVEYVERVVEKCQGLPLTLELMGCYLRDSDSKAELWKETIEKLGRAQAIDGDREDRLFASLRVSVDALSEEERNIFFEAAIISLGDAERAFAAWSTGYDSSITAWKNLLSRSLVKEREVVLDDNYGHPKFPRKYKRIWVHEHLRDLAKKLADFHTINDMKAESAEKALHLLNANGIKTKTRALHLHITEEGNAHPEALPPKPIKLSSLKKSENLKYLGLYGVTYKGSGKMFPKKLIELEWDTCYQERKDPDPVSYKLPISLEGMDSLTILTLSRWKVAKKFSQELGNLVKLRFLNLCWLEGLDHLPENFGDLSSLQDLFLILTNLSTLPRSFGNLSSLQDLYLHCPEVMLLPDSFGDLSSLVNLRISGCEKLASLPESFGNLSSLAALEIEDFGSLASLPHSFGRLSSLGFLRIGSCKVLQGLSARFGDLNALEDLELEGCVQLKRLPDSFGRLKALKSLEIGETDLEELPDSFGDLSSLVKLEIGSCDKLASLPESFGNLSSLATLAILDCGSLASLPHSFGRLSSLELLHIGLCKVLQGLSARFGDLNALEDLVLEGCVQLKRLPDSFGRLKALQSLEIAETNLEELPDSFGDLSALTYLHLNCSNLESLPASFVHLYALEELNLGYQPLDLGDLFASHRGFGRLQNLPDNCKLKALKKLTMMGATGATRQFWEIVSTKKTLKPRVQTTVQLIYDDKKKNKRIKRK